MTDEEKEYQDYQDYLAYTKAQGGSGLPAAKPDERGLISKAAGGMATALDYLPGISRTAIQKGADLATGGESAGEVGNALVGEAQPWGEYLKKSGVPEMGNFEANIKGKPTIMIPSEERKFMSPEDKTMIADENSRERTDPGLSLKGTGRDIAGTVLDVSSDPVMIGSAISAIPTGGASLPVGAARALQLLSKFGKMLKVATPMAALEGGLEAGSTGTKALGRAFSGLSKSEAEEFVKNPGKVYEMAQKIGNPQTVGEVQRTASELLEPAIKGLGEKRIAPLVEHVDQLTDGKNLTVDKSKLLSMAGHDPTGEMDSLINQVLTRDNPYGNITGNATMVAPATDLNALKRRGYQVADYKTNRSTAQMPTSKDAELAPLNHYLKGLIEQADPGIGPANAEIRRLNILRDRANAVAGNPLNPFSTESLDQMSTLSDLAKEADAPELLQFRNQLKTARSIVGKDAAKNMSGGSLKHSAIATGSRKLGRGLLLAEEAAPLSKMLGAGKQIATALPGGEAAQQLPPEIWAKILEAANGKTEGQ